MSHGNSRMMRYAGASRAACGAWGLRVLAAALAVSALAMPQVAGAAQAPAVQIAGAPIARVLRIDGIAILERTGQLRRILGVGEELTERDVISVGGDSHAMLEFRDQTRITLRPNTVFRVNAYVDMKSESMLLGLLKGGLRAVTGLIAKSRPEAVQFQTLTTTIGIRGTEFDARLCDDDCATEERVKPAARARLEVAARVVEINGVVGAGAAGRPGRIVVPGAAIYARESIATAPDAYAVLAFADGSRITLSGDTAVIIEQFRHDAVRPEQSVGVLRLSHGALRVLSVVGVESAPAPYRVETALGTLHARGSLFDAVCTGECSDAQSTAREEVARLKLQADRSAANANAEADKNAGAVSGRAPSVSPSAPVVALPPVGLVVQVLDGTVRVEAGAETVELKSPQAVAVAAAKGTPRALAPPAYMLANKAPRPDRVTVDPAMFGAPASETEPGLYVWVRDGTILLEQGVAPRASSAPQFIRTALGAPQRQVLEVSAGNAAVATRERLRPLPAVPNFMRFDPTPLPQRASIGYVPPAFRAPDRSITSTCAP